MRFKKVTNDKKKNMNFLLKEKKNQWSKDTANGFLF